MDESPVYAAVIVLNPEYKFDYFKANQEEHQDWIEHAEESVEDLWHTMYKDCATSTEAETTAKRALDSGLFLLTPRKEPSDFDQWVSRHKYKRPAMKQKQDEYRQYLETEHIFNQELVDSQPSSQLKSVNLCAFQSRHEA